MKTYENIELYAKSNNAIIAELGSRFKEYRIALRLTQKEISEQSGVSVMTIVRFEKGEGSSIRLDNLIALLRAIEKLEGISDIVPEMPRSLYDYNRGIEYTGKRRVKKRKYEK